MSQNQATFKTIILIHTVHRVVHGYDQTQPPQFPVVHPPPQETSIEISHDQENEDIQELFRKLLDDLQNIHKELAEYINSPRWNRHAFINDDDDVDYTIAITLVLSTEEPDNSLSMGDEHLDTILATKSDEVIKSSVEDLVPILTKDHFEIIINSNDDYSSSDDDSLYYENIEYVEESPHDSELVNLLIAEIEALRDNLAPSFEFLTKSSSTSPKPFLAGTDTFDNSLPKFENFCFDLEEISSGSTTTHSDISLPEYEAFSFYDDHIKEISSGSTTTHSDISLPEYEAFSFYDDHIEEISSVNTTTQSDISLPEYDSFIFDLSLPIGVTLLVRNSAMNPLTSYLHRSMIVSTLAICPIRDDHSPLLAYVVWIFLAYLTYPVVPPHLHSFGNEDTIFDPGITINRSYSFKPGLSHQCRTFKKFNTHRSHLNESPMEVLFSTLFPMDQ
nr:hypothetical protein [Tanacetum cinerariifolium]